MNYIINCDPVAWARPRYNGNTKHFFDKQAKDKEIYRMFVKMQLSFEGLPLYTGPLFLYVTFFMPLPSSKALKAKRQKQLVHTSRPDLSNLIKFFEDALQGVLFDDDATICHIDALKLYDEQPRTEFSIKQVQKSHYTLE